MTWLPFAGTVTVEGSEDQKPEVPEIATSCADGVTPVSSTVTETVWFASTLEGLIVTFQGRPTVRSGRVKPATAPQIDKRTKRDVSVFIPQIVIIVLVKQPGTKYQPHH